MCTNFVLIYLSVSLLWRKTVKCSLQRRCLLINSAGKTASASCLSFSHCILECLFDKSALFLVRPSCQDKIAFDWCTYLILYCYSFAIWGCTVAVTSAMEVLNVCSSMKMSRSVGTPNCVYRGVNKQTDRYWAFALKGGLLRGKCVQCRQCHHMRLSAGKGVCLCDDSFPVFIPSAYSLSFHSHYVLMLIRWFETTFETLREPFNFVTRTFRE